MRPPEPSDLTRPRRPLVMTFAAWTALCIGIHLPLLPGVILYLVIPICLEDGFLAIFATVPGLLVLAMILLSTLGTWATLAASWAYFRSQGRRGHRLILVALISEAMAVLILPILWRI